MGYTHYWYRPIGSAVETDTWQKICDDTKKLIDAAPGLVAFEDDQPGKPPQIDADAIRFNGIGRGGHETFLISRECPEQPSWRSGEPLYFAFCKTAGKPYDDIVVGILAIVAHHTKDFAISSDGSRHDWVTPVRRAAAAVGHPLEIPPKVTKPG